ncbi:hypothetical protein CROQUDRAFT_659509 [Cronartium quercuum f. sp. fusiforme G11]|uniref:Protein-lysine N-methyltransferase EFM4 n=1 Tax=Cronartium quercuum f. sp. fusiforme G11 TaxID=708437 RepID=A0A9P6NF62_9BASI|nr:hypothetical protein CROQUDRAFT_659509 [Cronartium quercuum f. sp. fusiforme G11]
METALDGQSPSNLTVETLPPSKLGTHEYWDLTYGRELESFEDIGDEGEVWFGEVSSDEILDWIARYLPPPTTPTTPITFSELEAAQDHSRPDSKSQHILDVGCGNGQLLFLLAQGGFPVSCLSGIDYVASSIELTSRIAKSKGIDGLRLEVKDILRDKIELPSRPRKRHGIDREGWDLITDKGTFDAICLSDEMLDGKKLCKHYPGRISNLLAKPGGIFLITSCNWTEQELISTFVTEETGLRYHSKIPRTSFTFGGTQGTTITTIAFQLA